MKIHRIEVDLSVERDIFTRILGKFFVKDGKLWYNNSKKTVDVWFNQSEQDISDMINNLKNSPIKNYQGKKFIVEDLIIFKNGQNYRAFSQYERYYSGEDILNSYCKYANQDIP